MKTLSIILSMVIVAPVLSAQDETPSDWQIMPSISVVKFFQGEEIVDQNIVYYPTYPAMYPYYDMTGYGYSGTGLNFTARCFNDEIKPLAFTFSGGITWYYQPDHYQYMLTSPAYVNSDIGFLMGHRDFTAFPFSVGVQAVFPYASRDRLMLFVGAEGNIHLIAGNVPTGDQAKAGYSVLGGVAVKFLEFGVRYTAFSDIKNLGAYFGLRFKSFGI